MLNDICYWLDLKKGSKALWLTRKPRIQTSKLPGNVTAEQLPYDDFFSKKDDSFDLCFCDFRFSCSRGYNETINNVFDQFQGEQILTWSVNSGSWSNFLIFPFFGFHFSLDQKSYSLTKNELQGLSDQWMVEKQLFVYPHKAEGFLLSDSAVFLNNLRIWFPHSRKIRMLSIFLKSKHTVQWLKNNWPIQILVFKRRSKNKE